MRNQIIASQHQGIAVYFNISCDKFFEKDNVYIKASKLDRVEAVENLEITREKNNYGLLALPRKAISLSNRLFCGCVTCRLCLSSIRLFIFLELLTPLTGLKFMVIFQFNMV